MLVINHLNLKDNIDETREKTTFEDIPELTAHDMITKNVNLYQLCSSEKQELDTETYDV